MLLVKRSLIAVCAWLFSASAYADGQALQGFGLTLGFAGAAGSVREGIQGEDYVGYFNDYGHQDTVAVLGVSYAHTFEGNFNVGTFLSHFNLGAVVSADMNSAVVGSWGNSDSLYTIKTENLKTIAVEPGMVVGRTSVAYLKLGFWRGDMSVKYASNGAEPETGDAALSAWSAGAGIRTQVNQHVTLGLEVEQLSFKEATTELPSYDTIVIEKIKQLRGAIVLNVVF